MSVKCVGEGDRVRFIPEGKVKPVTGDVLGTTIMGDVRVQWEEGPCYYLIKTIPLYEILEVIEPGKEEPSSK